MIVDFCVRISPWLISLTASKMLESVKDLLYNPKPCTTLSVILEKEVYACWLVLSVFFASFHSKVSKVWKQKANSERSKGTVVTTLYQFLNYVYCIYCLNSKCEFLGGKAPSIFEPWRQSGMLTDTIAGQNTDSRLMAPSTTIQILLKAPIKKKNRHSFTRNQWSESAPRNHNLF